MTVPDMLLDRDQLDSLLELMLQIPGLDDSDVRDVRLEDVTRTLRRPVDARRFADKRHDLASIINACSACSGGLRALAHVLYEHHRGEASSRLLAWVDGLAIGVLAPPDREALRTHLVGIAVGQIAESVGELVDAAPLRSLGSWRDIPAAIRMLEELPLPDDGVHQLLTFTDRLARIVGGAKGDDLRRWIDKVAGGLGVDAVALAELRRASAVMALGGRPSATAPTQRGASPSTPGAPTGPRRSEDSGMIWGGVPFRNRNFTGRVALLDRLSDALRSGSRASVLPQTLHGMGGVGKTQLVIEYVHRHLAEYDLVWWIPAEQTATVLSSLTLLAERLGLAITEDLQQTARTVLDALAGADLAWLLVYDNADDPATLDQFVPSTGGHVVLTTRNQEWSTVGQAIEVDVFERSESIELLQRRSQQDPGGLRIRTAEANELADKLGDLPLALEQAAAWYLATSMPIAEYIDLLDSHIKDLLSEGKPSNYPVTVAAFVTLAVEKLRGTAPATAQLFELFAYLGGEPIPVSLLREGKDAEVTEPLRGTLAATIALSRTVRDLSRHGLAKIDAAQRVQVHRLVQRVLRESLSPELARTTLRNVQNMLAKANPGDPDDSGQLERQRDMGPHLGPADMIKSGDFAAREAVIDHARYLYVTGDYENSRLLAERAAAVWELDTSHPKVGPDGEQTLVARAQVANASRVLGDSKTAARVARDAYERLKANAELGPRHELTLITGNQIGADLRIAGRYREALDFDRESVTLHRDVFGPGETYTLRAQANLAVDQRMIGDFLSALELDQDIADHWEDVGGTDRRALAAYINLARNLYGIGAYRAGLQVLDRWRPALQDTLGPGHSQVLLAGRTHGLLLRKSGLLTEAAEIIRDNQERVNKRFGEKHEFAVAATVSLANVLGELGELDEALALLDDAIDKYESDFGQTHPLTLVAGVNKAIVHRARGELTEATALDERCFPALSETLGVSHPYAICAGVSLATDQAGVGDHEAALVLSEEMWLLSRESAGGPHEARDGAEHPYVLMRGINLSLDLRATGAIERADTLFEESITGLRRALGREHPTVFAIEGGNRPEGDIEAPPT
jgi:tetratricopeptide (TPR) repeat protein